MEVEQTIHVTGRDIFLAIEREMAQGYTAGQEGPSLEHASQVPLRQCTVRHVSVRARPESVPP